MIGKTNAIGGVSEPVPKIRTVSGSVISISNALAMPAVSLIADINAVQNLNGYDSPWPAGGGKNLWQEYTTQTLNDVTLTNDNGKVTLNGTASADTYFDFDVSISVSAGTDIRIYAFNPVASSSNRLTMFVLTSSGNPQINLNSVNASYSGSSSSDRTITKLRLRVPSGVAFTNFVLYPYVQLGGDEPSVWTPYSNICPISGWSEAKVTRTGKNLNGGDSSVTLLRGSIRTKDVLTGISDITPCTYTISYRVTAHSGATSVTGCGVYDANGTPLFAMPNITANATGTYSKSYTGELPYRLYFYMLSSNPSDATITIEDIQLELGSTATAYAPYQGTDYTIDLDGTRYGGSLDVTTGVLTVTHGIVDATTIEWAKPSAQNNPNGTYYMRSNVSVPFVGWDNGGYASAKSNALVKSDTGTGTLSSANTFWWNNASTGWRAIWGIANGGSTLAEFTQFLSDNNVVFYSELATPQTVQLTPTQVQMLLGNNTLWADSGDIELQYWARR